MGWIADGKRHMEYREVIMARMRPAIRRIGRNWILRYKFL